MLLLYEFPAPLAALSTLKKEDKRVCERFEIYLSGVELCNCFNELTDLNEQKKRFEAQAKEKKKLYGYDLPEPEGALRGIGTGPSTKRWGRFRDRATAFGFDQNSKSFL